MRPTPEYREVEFEYIRWRAPEMPTGFGIGLFSDVFARALVVSGPSFSRASRSISLILTSPVHLHLDRSGDFRRGGLRRDDEAIGNAT